MFFDAAGIENPEANVAECCALGPAGTGAKPISLTIRLLVGSISGAEKPMPSIHIATLPWLKLVWLSIQLKPTVPGGAVSTSSFLYSSPAHTATSVSISRVLPSLLMVS